MAVIHLIGVLEDGSKPIDPSVPENPRVELAIIKGTSAQLVLKAVTRSGVPITPVGTLTLTVKQKPEDMPPLAQLTGTWTPMLGAGTAVFAWASTHMRDVPWGRYTYDIKLVNGSEVNVLIPASPFGLMPAV
jgi:hypothetical protein